MMRPYEESDLAIVMDIANRAWAPIRQMARQALGDQISDLLNPEATTKAKEQVRSQAENDRQFWVYEEQARLLIHHFRVNKNRAAVKS